MDSQKIVILYVYYYLIFVFITGLSANISKMINIKKILRNYSEFIVINVNYLHFVLPCKWVV